MILRDNYKKLNLPLAVIEHIFSAISMFVVYKIIIKYLGVELLGLWSILLAIISLTSIGTSGFASSAVKFVAKYITKNDKKKLISVIETTFITVITFSTILLLIISMIIYLFKTKLFTTEEFLVITDIYPYLIGSFIIAFSSSVFLSSLDGLKLIYLRSSIGILSKVSFLISAIFLVKIFGLKGLAIGLLIQNSVLIIFSAFFLKQEIKGLNILFFRFNKKTFSEIFNYGYKFQIISIFQMLVDPLTKFLLKSYGGLTSVGYFELIYKFLYHTRQLIVVAINTIIPTVASLKEQNTNNLREKFYQTYSFTFIFSIIILTFVFSLFPLLMTFVDLKMNSEVSIYSSFIFLGLLFNLFSVTPYVFNLGTGRLKMNLISMGLMAILNLILSSIFGYFYLGKGVIFGWMLAQITSSLVLLFLFIRSEKILLKVLVSRLDITLIASIILSLITLYIVNKNNNYRLVTLSLVNFIIPFVLMVAPIFMNKKFKFIKKYIKEKLNF